MARLSVRLPKTELRRIKSLAAKRGVTLQEAVRQALEAWASPVGALQYFERQMNVAEEIMHHDRDILKALSR